MCYCAVYSNAQVRRSNIKFNEFRNSSKKSYFLFSHSSTVFFFILYFKSAQGHSRLWAIRKAQTTVFVCVLVRDQWIEESFDSNKFQSRTMFFCCFPLILWDYPFTSVSEPSPECLTPSLRSSRSTPWWRSMWPNPSGTSSAGLSPPLPVGHVFQLYFRKWLYVSPSFPTEHESHFR